MADDPANQQQFLQDVAALEKEGGVDYSDPANLPDTKTLLELLQQMQGIPPEELEQLKAGLMGGGAGIAGGHFNPSPTAATALPNYYVFYAMLGILAMLFGKRKAGGVCVW